MTSPHDNPEIDRAMAEALEAVERRAAKPAQEGAGDTDADDPPPLDSPTTELDEARAELETKKKDLAAMREQMLRLAADFENYRKRAAKDAEDTRKYGTERVLRDILPVLDNLERALAHSESDTSPVLMGVRMVAKQMLDTLGQYGVRTFASKGVPFDPERHEAVGQSVVADAAPGSIVEELQRGYVLHERLLRPARVIVAAVPADESNESPGEGGGTSGAA